MVHFCVGPFCVLWHLLRVRSRVLRAGEGGLGALLRVPRPLASSLTGAEHPGRLRPEWRGLRRREKDHSQQQGGGTRQSEVKQEAAGRSTRTAARVVGSENDAAFGAQTLFVLNFNLADFKKLGNLCLQKF